MTRRVRYLIDTPNSTLGGDSYRPGHKGDMGAEAWVREEEMTRLRERLEVAQAWFHRRYSGGHDETCAAKGRVNRNCSCGWDTLSAALAALPPPQGGDDEGEG